TGRRIVMTLLAVAIVLGSVFALYSVRQKAAVRSTATPQRQSLMDARDLAAKMTLFSAWDEAYADIVHRALPHGDFESACQVGCEMTVGSSKDQALLETVQAALQARQPMWATRAADKMTMTSDRDAAIKKILAATSDH